MKKNLLYGLLAVAILLPSFAYAVSPFASNQVGVSAANGFVLQTNGTASTWVATSTLGISGGSGGTGSISTSTTAVAGYIPVWANASQLTGTSSLFQFGSNIGIGTTTPNHLLTITGSDTSTSLTTTAIAEANIINTNTTANNSSQLAFDTFDSNNTAITGAKIAGVFTSHTAGAASADLAFINKNAGTNQENARLTSNGNFGIGLSNATARLETVGADNLSTTNNLMLWNASSSPLFTVANNGQTTITSASANALTVGANGATNPAFNIDASTASSATGINIKSAAAAGGVALSAISSGTNENLTIDAKGTGVVGLATAATSGGYNIGNTTNTISSNIRVGTSAALRFAAGSNFYTINSPLSSNQFSAPTATGASTVRFQQLAAADTSLTAGTVAPEVYFNEGVTRQHASNTIIPLQRDFRISGSTHSFVTAGGVITQAAAFSVDGPNSAGTNATITNSAAIYVPTSVVSASTTNSYGLQVSAATGATNNYAASTTGRFIMQGLTTSASTQSVLLCGSGATGGEVVAESVACVASAARYKDNIATTTFSLDGLMQLQPISFDWKKDWLNSNTDPNVTGTQYSLVADEVQKVFPQLVAVTSATTTFEGKTYAPGSVQGLEDLNHWVSAIVSWLQQIVHRQDAQQVQIDQLQAQLTAQQAEIDSLKHKK